MNSGASGSKGASVHSLCHCASSRADFRQSRALPCVVQRVSPPHPRSDGRLLQSGRQPPPCRIADHPMCRRSDLMFVSRRKIRRATTEGHYVLIRHLNVIDIAPANERPARLAVLRAMSKSACQQLLRRARCVHRTCDAVQLHFLCYRCARAGLSFLFKVAKTSRWFCTTLRGGTGIASRSCAMRTCGRRGLIRLSTQYWRPLALFQQS